MKKFKIFGLSLLLWELVFHLLLTLAHLDHHLDYLRRFASASSEKALKYHVGSFYLEFNLQWLKEGSSKKIRIFHQDAPDHSVWETLDHGAFIEAAIGEAKIKENQGTYQIKDTILSECNHQTVDSITQENLNVILRGRLSASSLQNPPCSMDYRLKFHAYSDKELGFEITLNDHSDGIHPTPENYRVFFRYSSSSDEKFFGFGEQYSFFNLKGKQVPIINQEQGIGRGLQPLTWAVNSLSAGSGGAWHTTYSAVPQYITNKLHSIFLENYDYSIFNLTQPDRVTIELLSPIMKGRILYGGNPLSLIETFTSYAGRMRPLPEWTQKGATIGIQGGSGYVLQVEKQLEAAGTPVAAFWLQDWVGSFRNQLGTFLKWNWEIDRTLYPDWTQMRSVLATKGIRILSYVNPFLMDVTRHSPGNTSMLEEAIRLGILVQKQDRSPYLLNFRFSTVGLIDLSNLMGQHWIKETILRNLTELGVSGWMADFGESFPLDARVSEDQGSALRYHNKYAEDWAKVQNDVLTQAGIQDEAVVFMRTGFTRSPGLVSLFWLGDQLTSWDAYDGIKTALIGLLSSGISGFSLNHSDIGGYTAVNLFPFRYYRTKELFMRWTEMNAFTAFFRTHEGNQPQLNHQFNSDAETLAHFTRFSKIFQAFTPYRKKLMNEAFLSGTPLVRSLFLHYPSDTTATEISHEFLLGSDFLIAPILDPGKSQVRAYFPQARWKSLFGDMHVDASSGGLWQNVPAPLGKPAVFYQSDSEDAKVVLQNLYNLGLI